MTTVSFYAGPEHAPFAIGDGARRALLIHGFPGTPAEMRPLGALLAGAGYRATAILLPGMGTDIVRLAAMRESTWLDAGRAAWAAARREDPAAILAGNS